MKHVDFNRVKDRKQIIVSQTDTRSEYVGGPNVRLSDGERRRCVQNRDVMVETSTER